MDPPSLTEGLLKALLEQLLLALDFLHSEAEAIHTDIQAKNIMIGTSDSSIFTDWEKLERGKPCPRKVVDGHTIYESQSFSRRDKAQSKYGLPVLSDFGEARIGKVHCGLIQPDLYRASEVILGIEWASKVDIWNVGTLVWDLFEDGQLFDGRGPDKQHSDGHLAEMTAILGPPPECFPRKSPNSQEYWDQSGQWRGQPSIPDISLEDLEDYLEGENKDLFLQFMRKMLQWDPDDRQSASDLLSDPWLNSP